MDTAVVVIKKLKAEEVTDSFCEMHGLSSRSAAACREELIKYQPNTSPSKKLNVLLIIISWKFVYCTNTLTYPWFIFILRLVPSISEDVRQSG